MKLNTICPDCGVAHDAQSSIHDGGGTVDNAVFVCSRCFTLARLDNGHLVRMTAAEAMELPKDVLDKILATAHKMDEVNNLIDGIMGGVLPEGVQIFGDTEALRRMLQGGK